jgi:hypothetical protein
LLKLIPQQGEVMKTPTAQAVSTAAQSIDEVRLSDERQSFDELRWSDERRSPDESEWFCHASESFEHELGVPADDQERAGRVIHRALRACPDLGEKTPARDALWVTVQDTICTTAPKMVRPFGSSKPFLVTQEQATDELITAMTWLAAHEAEARTYTPLNLFVVLRGVATKSGSGSARAAQADSLRGITEVPPGRTVGWGALNEVDAA